MEVDAFARFQYPRRRRHFTWVRINLIETKFVLTFVAIAILLFADVRNVRLKGKNIRLWRIGKKSTHHHPPVLPSKEFPHCAIIRYLWRLLTFPWMEIKLRLTHHNPTGTDCVLPFVAKELVVFYAIAIWLRFSYPSSWSQFTFVTPFVTWNSIKLNVNFCGNFQPKHENCLTGNFPW